MTHNRYVNAILFAMLLASSACADITYEGKYAYSDGWRRGKVVEIAAGDHVTDSPRHDCRKQLGADAANHGLFAVVSYFGNRWVSAITSVPSDTSFKPGDAVYVNITDCRATLMSRTQQ